MNTKQKKNLAIISQFPPKLGGISTYSKRNFEIFSQMEDLHVGVIPVNGIKDSLMIIIKLKSFKPDYVRFEFNIAAYGISTLPIALALFLYKRSKQVKYIIIYHEVKRETDKLGVCGIIFYKYFSSLFDKIVVHTEEAKRILCTTCNIQKDKIYVIPLGIYNSKTTSIDHNTITDKTILYFGYIHTDKGLDYLIKAIYLMKTEYANDYNSISVCIAGDIRKRSGVFRVFELGDILYKKRLVRLISKYDLTQKIKLSGYINESNIQNLINSAYIIVMPYTNVEQSGVLNLVIPFSKPIIASNIGGLSETLKDSGYLVPPRDAKAIADGIHKILNDSNLYKNIADCYKNLVVELDPKIILNKFLEIIQRT